MKTLEYNYRHLSLVDIRYRGNNDKGYYILSLKDKTRSKVISPININKSIFETVLYKYFTPLFIDQITRKDLFDLQFVAYLSSGSYYQYCVDTNEYEKIEGKAGRVYVSRLDIQGDLDELTYTDKIGSNELHSVH